jgi:hypothetical protein
MTPLPSPTNATAPEAGAATTATLKGEYTPAVKVTSLTAAPGTIPAARIVLEDSPDGTTWTPLAMFKFAGTIEPDAPNEASERITAGHAIQTHVRQHLVAITGTITYQASI